MRNTLITIGRWLLARLEPVAESTRVYNFYYRPGLPGQEYLGSVIVNYVHADKIEKAIPRIEAFMRETVTEYE